MSQASLTAGPSAAIRAANYRRVQLDSVFIGVVNASGTFLPVFLLRMGASASDVGLLTALPALTAFLLAIPFGRWLQPRGQIVKWYSRLRLIAWSSYAVMALVTAVLPREHAIPVLLLVWALASLPSTAALVTFALVMDGAAGPGGRFDLLGRRWAIAGVSATIAVALVGQLLTYVAFPLNFEVFLFLVTLAGFGSFLQSSRIQIVEPPKAVVAPPASDATPGVPWQDRLRGLWRLVTSNRSFIRFEMRGFVYVLSIGVAMPVLPLFYVHELGAPDAWIGIIGAASSAGSVLGYLGARQLARRRGGSATLLPSLLAMAAGPLVLSTISWLPAVAAVGFATGVAGAGAQLAMFDQLMRRIPTEHGVTFSSVDQSISNLAIVIGPNVGGLLAVAIGVRGTMLFMTAIGLVAFGLFLVESRRRATAHGIPAVSAPAGAQGGAR
ncbi:MAG TPA: MFS transporter [Candidatus Limnocylindrales bacterium]|nr:MFS transporter [Candidatus Limnocylindrales bacterium]